MIDIHIRLETYEIITIIGFLAIGGLMLWGCFYAG